MRRSIQNIVAPAKRNLHTSLPTPRPRRSFHQSSLAAFPRRRNFFTSNQLLAINGDRGDPTAQYGPGSNGVLDQQASAAPAARRKPARTSASKKNLRATAMTKKTKRTAIHANNSTAGSIADETDYMHTIRAISVAQYFDMDVVEEILHDHSFAIDPDQAGFDTDAVVHARSANGGDIFVFSSGTVVAWSVPADFVERLATKQLLRAAQYPHMDDLEMEDLDFSTDDTRDTSYIRGEEVVLGTRDGDSHEGKLDITMAKIAFSMGLARSTKLAVLENKLDEFLENSRPVARTLAGGAELSQPRQFVLKKTGEILGLRSQLNHYSELTDDLPDIFWDKESRIEEYYNRISKILDVNPRIKQLNAKIDYAYETVSVMREMSSEKQSNRLEWIIIILISVEVLSEFRRVYREEFHD
ncbi:hypothetical protein BX600DRAFT_510920 [Xylariales sp. PMI_506]|nr:hypothetical protein BX600DRAFT_510920 [Xylariales sp. PMI_506]